MREGTYALSVRNGPSPGDARGRRASASRPRTPCWSRDRRRPAALVLAAAGLALAAPAPALAEQTATQRFFSERLQADKDTSKEIKDLLRTRQGFVDRTVTFKDLTGDEPRGRRRARAVRRRRGRGRALRLLHRHGREEQRPARSSSAPQELRRAQTRIRDGVLRYRSARPQPGDELCCPTARRRVAPALARAAAPLHGRRAPRDRARPSPGATSSKPGSRSCSRRRSTRGWRGSAAAAALPGASRRVCRDSQQSAAAHARAIEATSFRGVGQRGGRSLRSSARRARRRRVPLTRGHRHA